MTELFIQEYIGLQRQLTQLDWGTAGAEAISYHCRSPNKRQATAH
jgi:hypothetical protein